MNEREIFIAALDKEAPAERRAYLDQVCQDDAALRGRVEELLEVHDRAGSFLNRPVVVIDARSDVEARWFAFGRTDGDRLLTVVFTIRGSRLRVISARPMSRPERKRYDQTTSS